MTIPAHIRIFLLCILTALLAGGCIDIGGEYRATTRVFPDGSCEKVFEFEGDSSDVFEAVTLYPIDSTWNVVIKRGDVDTSVHSDILLTAQKRFKDMTAVNRALFSTENIVVRHNIHATFEKRFRWFFTFLTYRETYKRVDPFKNISLSDYLTGDEIALVQKSFEAESSGIPDTVDTDELEDEFEEWLEKNIFEEFFRIFLEGTEQLDDTVLTVERVRARKEEMFDSINDFLEFDAIMRGAKRTLETDDVWKVVGMNKDAFHAFDNKLKFIVRSIIYTCSNAVIMPGLIISTNAPAVEGNRLTWKIDNASILLADYEMQAESRIVNWWFLITAVLFGAVVVAGIIAGSIRLRKR